MSGGASPARRITFSASAKHDGVMRWKRRVFKDALWRARPAQSSAFDRWSRAGTGTVLLVQAGARTVSQPPTPGFWWLVGDDRYMGLAGEIGQHNRPGGTGVLGRAAAARPIAGAQDDL